MVDEDHPRCDAVPERVRQHLRQLTGGLDAGEAGADDDRRRGRGIWRTIGQAADVRLQLHRAVVGVDVVTELGEPGKVRLDHPAAHRQHQAVVAQGCAVGCAHRRSRSVDSCHVRDDMADTDWIEQFLQRDSARAEVGLVVADPNIVEWLRTDDGDVDRSWRSAELVQPPGGAQRGPQPGEPGPENEDTLGRRHRHIVMPRGSTDKSGTRFPPDSATPRSEFCARVVIAENQRPWCRSGGSGVQLEDRNPGDCSNRHQMMTAVEWSCCGED